MVPIQELLNRIRWDAHFDGDFVLGYYDRTEGRILRVPFTQVGFAPGDHFAFNLVDDDGNLHSVPLHRVKEVYRNGALIWHREH